VSSTDRDVTAQKNVERLLLESDRQKDEFLAMLGHELRNPLAAIRSAASLLRDDGADARARERTRGVLERQSTHMATLLDGLLDVSRIVRGKVVIDKSPTDLVEVCRSVLDAMATREGSARFAQFHIDLPAEPVWVVDDRVRLSQVVDNLASNAAKYTPEEGTIDVTLSTRDNVATLSVRDTGAGIEPALLSHLFQVFRQAKQTLARSDGGLGLGLALVKALTELHGGTVEARSDGPGTGAEFIVRLPLTTSRPTSRNTAAPEVVGLKVLVVEDNDDASEMLRYLLEREGHQVWTATNGAAALEAAVTHRPDVMLSDLGLPGMLGYEVARAFRADERLRGIRLVALTGYGRPEDKQRCQNAGFDVHLTKPVDVDTLHQTLARLTQTGGD
jgi:two-component system CheB/CheR fusion protein